MEWMVFQKRSMVIYQVFDFTNDSVLMEVLHKEPTEDQVGGGPIPHPIIAGFIDPDVTTRILHHTSPPYQ